MPIFHNPTPHRLRFDIASERYDVPPGGEVEIPRTLAYVPKSRGLPLVLGPAPTPGAPAAEVVDVPAPRAIYPEGVEVGGAPRAAADEDEDESGEEDGHGAADSTDDAPAEDPVARTVASLRAQGVAMPGNVRPKGRR